jgi:hypothetical protein
MKEISSGVPLSRSSVTFRYLSKLRLSYTMHAQFNPGKDSAEENLN